LGVSCLAFSQGLPPLVWSVNAHTSQVQDVTFNRDGSQLVTAGEDKSIKVWRASDGAFLRGVSGLQSAVGCATWSPDDKWIASGSFIHEGSEQTDHTVRIWNAASLFPVAVLPGNSSDVQGLAFSPNGQYLASAGRDGFVRLWTVNGWTLTSIAGTEGWFLMDIQFTPDGSKLVTMGFFGDFEIRSVPSLQLLAKVPGQISSVFSSLTMNRVGKVAVASAFNRVSWLDLTTQTWSGLSTTELTQIYGADVSQDDRLLLMAGLGGAQEIEIWDIASRTVLRKYDSSLTQQFDAPFSLRCQPGAKRYAYGTWSGKLFMATNPFVKVVFVGPKPTS